MVAYTHSAFLTSDYHLSSSSFWGHSVCKCSGISLTRAAVVCCALADCVPVSCAVRTLFSDARLMLSLAAPGPTPLADSTSLLLSVHVVTSCFVLLHRIASNILSADVGDMNSDLKLRGVKRRLESSAAAAAAAGLRVKQLNSGHHRPGSPLLSSSPLSSAAASPLPAKVLSSATIESLSLSKIRQLVFNLSMCKLSRYRQTADPSLVRSVLICNTLKRLERELDREGIKINFGPNGVSFVPPPTSCGTSLLLNNPNHSTSSPQPQQPPQPQVQSRPVDSKLLSHTESSHESHASTKFSLQESSPSGRLTPFLREEDPGEPVDAVHSQPVLSCDDDDDSGLWSPDPAHRLSSASWTETMSFSSGDVSNDSTSADMDKADTHAAPAPASSSILLHELRPPAAGVTVLRSEGEVTSVKAAAAVSRCSKTSMDTSASPPPTASSSTSSSSTTEEIFGDIDLSLYDFDLLSPIAAPNVKLTPVSAEELMRSITPAPDDTTASPISVHHSASTTTSPPQPLLQ